MSANVVNPFPIAAVTEMIHHAVLEERARCIRIATHAGHLAKFGAMKLSFGSGEVPTPLEAARLQSEYIATSIELCEDPGVCNCEGSKV